MSTVARAMFNIMMVVLIVSEAESQILITVVRNLHVHVQAWSRTMASSRLMARMLAPSLVPWSVHSGLLFPLSATCRGPMRPLSTELHNVCETVVSRRLFTPKRRISITGDDSEATAIGGIPAGSTGRVLYEGNSWRAKCADETRDIAPSEAVFVVGKKGNTLIVLPLGMLDKD